MKLFKKRSKKDFKLLSPVETERNSTRVTALREYLTKNVELPPHLLSILLGFPKLTVEHVKGEGWAVCLSCIYLLHPDSFHRRRNPIFEINKLKFEQHKREGKLPPLPNQRIVVQRNEGGRRRSQSVAYDPSVSGSSGPMARVWNGRRSISPTEMDKTSALDMFDAQEGFGENTKNAANNFHIVPSSSLGDISTSLASPTPLKMPIWDRMSEDDLRSLLQGKEPKTQVWPAQAKEEKVVASPISRKKGGLQRHVSAKDVSPRTISTRKQERRRSSPLGKTKTSPRSSRSSMASRHQRPINSNSRGSPLRNLKKSSDSVERKTSKSRKNLFSKGKRRSRTKSSPPMLIGQQVKPDMPRAHMVEEMMLAAVPEETEVRKRAQIKKPKKAKRRGSGKLRLRSRSSGIPVKKSVLQPKPKQIDVVKSSSPPLRASSSPSLPVAPLDMTPKKALSHSYVPISPLMSAFTDPPKAINPTEKPLDDSLEKEDKLKEQRSMDTREEILKARASIGKKRPKSPRINDYEQHFYPIRTFNSYSVLPAAAMPEDLISPSNPRSTFKPVGTLDHGTTSKVVLARTRKKKNNKRRLVALKQFPANKRRFERTAFEIKTLKGVSHPNLVKFYDAFYYEDKLTIAMEYCNAGNLRQYVKVNRFPPKERILAYLIKKILHGLRYLHDVCQYIHRDIKTLNILLNTDCEVKIVDFGISTKCVSGEYKLTRVSGSRVYMAPEVIRTDGYGLSADIWSLGATMYELMMRSAPYERTPSFTQLYSIATAGAPTISEEDAERWSPQALNFFNKCTIFDKTKRPTAAKLLKHPFMNRAPNTITQDELLPRAYLCQIAVDTRPRW